jgi:hypothetical protein
MRMIPAALLVGGLVGVMGGCAAGEFGNDGRLSGAPPVAQGVYADGLDVQGASLRGDIGQRTELSGPAHRVEIYQWDLGTDLLVYSAGGEAFTFIYLDQPLEALPVGTTAFAAGRSQNGVQVNSQLCVTGGSYDVPASEIVVTVAENLEGSREYSFDSRSAGSDWAVTEVTVGAAL